MLEQDQVVSLLTRLFRGGRLRRMPKKPQEAEMLAALSLVDLDPDGLFDEAEVNLHLLAWLGGISAEDSALDHVTLRRYLVDYGFLRRAADGLVYRMRPERLAEVLSAAARTVDPKQVYADVTAERHQRRHQQQPD